MSWEKLGLIYRHEPCHPKLRSHAANPLAIHLAGDIFRVYWSGRDDANRSSVGYVDLDMRRLAVTYVHPAPVFEFGPADSFYSHGVSIGNCYSAGGRTYVLFMGWQIPEGGHWRGDIGRLELKDDRSLVLADEGPFLSIDAVDPVSLSYPWVALDRDGLFRMWYGSTLTWDAGNGEMLHVIHEARSVDGEHWIRRGLCLPYEIGVAQAFSRPTVLPGTQGGYEMWFSYRSGTGQKYRIGYARCLTDENWQLHLGLSGIDVSPNGWDSEMIEYPFVFEHRGDRFMLYNGNDFGRDGFGLAIWKH